MLKANTVFDIFSTLSDEERENFMALLQQQKIALKKENETKYFKRKKVPLITKNEAIEYLLNTIFIDSKRKIRKQQR